MATSGKWSSEETAVLVYLVSRKADHEACCKIISLKCKLKEVRTVNGIRMKLDEIRKLHSELLNGRGQWDCKKVDKWLLNFKLPDREALLGVGLQELQIVAAVSRPRSHVQSMTE